MRETERNRVNLLTQGQPVVPIAGSILPQAKLVLVRTVRSEGYLYCYKQFRTFMSLVTSLVSQLRPLVGLFLYLSLSLLLGLAQYLSLSHSLLL